MKQLKYLFQLGILIYCNGYHKSKNFANTQLEMLLDSKVSYSPTKNQTLVRYNQENKIILQN